MKGIPGKPKYTFGEKVAFNIEVENKTVLCKGSIYVIDTYGTFEQNEEPSYDIVVENWPQTDEDCLVLVKHIRESCIIERSE